ncbi:EamA family transporter [Paenibacillus sp. N1-5-1-14]|uniref:EamA family transporter n=1 Tax=Paenibacillus radicibacter TaxID=2972488 RepID=UPI0021596AE3|nr:EamA family transporter [Paenibacillus radicibacter]MCR8645620.1 EamA family transporter [Paenibacillus radicibacter]
MKFVNIALILLNTCFLVTGQFLWKVGLMRKTNPFESIRTIVELFFSPWIFGGLVIYGIATVLWMFILTRVDISVAYPLQSIAYIMTAFGAYYVFNESLSPLKIMGCLVILIGVAMIGYSAKLS